MTIVTNKEVWILTLVMNVEIPLKFQRQAFVRFKFMILSTISDLKYLDNRYFYSFPLKKERICYICPLKKERL
jgi:hypothetical protein